MTEKKEAKKGLELLREPFPEHQISKLPKPTKKQTDDLKADYKLGIRCKICGGWHHKDVVHLDYVGHAALTDRLLDCDPMWYWSPVSFDQNGSPFIDKNGGIWINLTVCNVTRLGYGHPDGKTGGDAVKEAIGDALRNAAMRFGAALDLWHKGDLHLEEPQEQEAKTTSKTEPVKEPSAEEKAAREQAIEESKPIAAAIKSSKDEKQVLTVLKVRGDTIESLPDDIKTRIKEVAEQKLKELKQLYVASAG